MDQASELSLVESGFEPGKRNFLQLADKDGEQPQIASVSGQLGRREGRVETISYQGVISMFPWVNK